MAREPAIFQHQQEISATADRLRELAMRAQMVALAMQRAPIERLKIDNRVGKDMGLDACERWIGDAFRRFEEVIGVTVEDMLKKPDERLRRSGGDGAAANHDGEAGRRRNGRRNGKVEAD